MRSGAGRGEKAGDGEEGGGWWWCEEKVRGGDDGVEVVDEQTRKPDR